MRNLKCKNTFFLSKVHYLILLKFIFAIILMGECQVISIFAIT